jgi:hypothetical protein
VAKSISSILASGRKRIIQIASRLLPKARDMSGSTQVSQASMTERLRDALASEEE